MSEPMVVWVARDKEMEGAYPMWLGLYTAAPRLLDEWCWDGPGFIRLPGDWFPNLKPGECRRMLLVDAPEAGKEKGE